MELGCTSKWLDGDHVEKCEGGLGQIKEKWKLGCILTHPISFLLAGDIIALISRTLCFTNQTLGTSFAWMGS